MKRVILGILLSASPYLGAMHAPMQNPVISITQPQPSKVGNVMQIVAYDGAIEVGYITFAPKKKNSHRWKIIALRVHQEYRQTHVGKKLMKHCIAYIKSQHAKMVLWTAYPLDQSINLHTLITIYRHLAESIGYTMDSLSMDPLAEVNPAEVIMRLEI